MSIKTLIAVIISWVYITTATYSVMQSTESEKKAELLEIKYQEALRLVYKQYQWKSERLTEYTNLVYNTNGGAIYEKK